MTDSQPVQGVQQGVDLEHRQVDREQAGRVPTAEDSLRVGLLIANAIAAAVYGTRGELRERREGQK